MAQQQPVQPTEQDIQNRYRQMQAECQQYVNKISEMEQERNEHRLVIKTLKPLDSNRIAHRMIQGVLVERTVGEVLPVLENMEKNLCQGIEVLGNTLNEKDKAAKAFKEEHGIRTEEEARQLERQQRGEA